MDVIPRMEFQMEIIGDTYFGNAMPNEPNAGMKPRWGHFLDQHMKV